uniref:Uncharacterized protein n=1 Tax=Rhizophora mucronata TaxID=61149 RepID=A0A2P2JAN7_RHIMU
MFFFFNCLTKMAKGEFHPPQFLQPGLCFCLLSFFFLSLHFSTVKPPFCQACTLSIPTIQLLLFLSVSPFQWKSSSSSCWLSVQGSAAMNGLLFYESDSLQF